ncbi:hypothetical protein MSIBF_A4340003 [groundwater metagenome]|uniref:Uncharacterized protein n=1 Tax=groundwater metagenome TaxID=717931 RepID=A0A098EC91_9ZZZZ
MEILSKELSEVKFLNVAEILKYKDRIMCKIKNKKQTPI